MGLQVDKYEDPQQAAIALVCEAYRLWLQYEVRTDDITAVVIHIEDLESNVKATLRYIHCSCPCSVR